VVENCAIATRSPRAAPRRWSGSATDSSPSSPRPRPPVPTWARVLSLVVAAWAPSAWTAEYRQHAAEHAAAMRAPPKAASFLQLGRDRPWSPSAPPVASSAPSLDLPATIFSDPRRVSLGRRSSIAPRTLRRPIVEGEVPFLETSACLSLAQLSRHRTAVAPGAVWCRWRKAARSSCSHVQAVLSLPRPRSFCSWSAEMPVLWRPRKKIATNHRE
jgi:hypothetical protein